MNRWMKLKRLGKDLIRKFSQDTFREITLITGFFALMRGLWIIHPAAMWVIGGIMLLWFGFPARGVK